MSFRLSIAPKERKASRFVGKVRRALQKAFDEEHASQRKLSQAELARILGVDRSVVNRQLMGTENLTIRVIAEYAWALRREPRFALEKQTLQAGSNYPESGPPTKNAISPESNATPIKWEVKAPPAPTSSNAKLVIVSG